MRILLLNDTSSWYHFGCAATSTALKDELIKRNFEITSVPITKSYQFVNAPQTAKTFLLEENFTLFKKTNPTLIEQIDQHDVIIINGEGTLHGIRPAVVNLLYIAYISKTYLNKHVEIINHSVYPQDDLSLDNQDIIELYQLVYNKIDFCAIREPVSLKLMHQLGIKATESFDCMPLYIKNNYKLQLTSQADKKENILLISGSAAWTNLHMLSHERGSLQKFEPDLLNYWLFNLAR